MAAHSRNVHSPFLKRAWALLLRPQAAHPRAVRRRVYWGLLPGGVDGHLGGVACRGSLRPAPILLLCRLLHVLRPMCEYCCCVTQAAPPAVESSSWAAKAGAVRTRALALLRWIAASAHGGLLVTHTTWITFLAFIRFRCASSGPSLCSFMATQSSRLHRKQRARGLRCSASSGRDTHT